NPVPLLRRVGLLEACSFLVLVGVAMPLKYVAGPPGAVKVLGWIHGLFFIVFCGALLRTVVVARWSMARAALIFVAALLPFGPFVVDWRMKGYASGFAERE